MNINIFLMIYSYLYRLSQLIRNNDNTVLTQILSLPGLIQRSLKSLALTRDDSVAAKTECLGFFLSIIIKYNKMKNKKYHSVGTEEFEDTKGESRIRISKKNRQHNGQKKKYKRTNNDQQNIHIKLKIE